MGKPPMIITTSIGALVAASMLVAWRNRQEGPRGPLAACRSNVLVLATAIETCEREQQLPVKSLQKLVPAYLKQLPTCPVSGTNTYVLMREDQSPNFTVCCSGRHHGDRECYPAYNTRIGTVK